MTKPRRTYIDGLFGQMHLRFAGSTASHCAPLLCIHMSPMTGLVFERFIAVMGSHRHTIAFDTPGYGQSDTPAHPPTIEDYARALLSGLDALGITGPIDLLGYHTGAMIASAMAVMATDRIRRVALISAPIFSASERKAFTEEYTPPPVDIEGSHLVRRWNSFVYHNLRPGVRLDEVAEAFREAMTGGRREAWGHRAAFAFDLASSLAATTQPALIVNPGDDLQIQTRKAQGLARKSRLVELPGWGHGFLDHHTGEAAQLVSSFLDAPHGCEFDSLAIPASALGPRFPAEALSFAPPAAKAGVR